MRRIIQKKEEENQLRVAQQHLANERTYLAWLRTGIAIIGIGFLTVTLHLTIAKTNHVSHGLVIFIVILSCFLGIGVIVTAVIQYLRKRRQIQKREFRSSYKFVLFVSLFLVILIMLAGGYVLLLI